MRKIAVLVLLSLVFVSLLQCASFAIIDTDSEGRVSRTLERGTKAAERYSNGDKDGANAEMAQAVIEATSPIVAGAATGAAVGSFVPLIGTAVGAGLGILAGWLLSD